ncbi:MAG: HmuY family protein [Myxococcaceae bacterium]|nr:HmuY family protein [Myxococcaceae bacterium]
MRRVALTFGLLFSCAPDLRDDYPFDGVVAGDFLENKPDGELTLSVVDATNKEASIYIDLGTASVVGVGEGWDIAFQRFNVATNGGSSGVGPVRVAVIKDGDFIGLKQAPAEGYQQDGTGTVINTAEGGWYTYDLGVHKLVTREDLFYVIDTGEGFFKLKMKSYYDDAGTSARLQFWWGPVQSP